MIRVVIDTNVVVSANLKDEGLPAAILDLAAHKKILMCVSEPILAEYTDVLQRSRLNLPRRRVARSLAVIRKTSLFVEPTRTVTVIKNDDPDNRFLECAHAAGADYLVTGNTKHFPVTFENTLVVTPKQFTDLLSSALRRTPQ
jgi:putative PIN family toxin of toxin-antitoxin system